MVLGFGECGDGTLHVSTCNYWAKQAEPEREMSFL